MIVLAGPVCNDVLKLLHLAGGKKNICLYCQANTAEANSPAGEFTGSTSSFSVFREICKLFTFSCSLRSLSRSPVFSLLDISSCSCHNRRAVLASTWTCKGYNLLVIKCNSLDKYFWFYLSCVLYFQQRGITGINCYCTLSWVLLSCR